MRYKNELEKQKAKHEELFKSLLNLGKKTRDYGQRPADI